MASVNEVENVGRTALGAALKAGLDTLDLNQSVTFIKYQQMILPLDGYVFWVKTTESKTIMGAVHYATDTVQQEATSQSNNQVVFTAEDPIESLNRIAPDTLWIGSFDGIRFAFSSRGMYFQQANLHHYFGMSIYPTMEPQIIDSANQIDPNQVIVSNSLPIWLSLSGYNPAWPVDIPMPAVPLYPSFLIPGNFRPPYGAIHVEPDQTYAYQVHPLYDNRMNENQLAHDRVVVTLYGCNNRTALDFKSAVLQYTLDTDHMGIVGVPSVVLDDKLPQSEMQVIAQRKRIIFEVSYNQGTVRDIARQLIVKATVGLYAEDVHIGDIVMAPPIPTLYPTKE